MKGLLMSRDTRDRRPPLRASELLPSQVMVYSQWRAVACPGCGRWQVPHHGRIRRHGLDGREWFYEELRRCPGSGRRVWFDLTSAQWLAGLRVAALDAASIRRGRVHGSGRAPVIPPVHNGRCGTGQPVSQVRRP
jgi:hypothetical protein